MLKEFYLNVLKSYYRFLASILGITSEIQFLVYLTKSKILPKVDYLALAASPDNGVEVLLTAFSDPTKFVVQIQMVYNSNPTKLHIRQNTGDGNFFTQQLTGPDFVSQQTTLTASGLSFEIFNPILVAGRLLPTNMIGTNGHFPLKSEMKSFVLHQA